MNFVSRRLHYFGRRKAFKYIIQRAGVYLTFLKGAQYRSATARIEQSRQLAKIIKAPIDRQLGSRQVTGIGAGTGSSDSLLSADSDENLLGRIVVDLAAASEQEPASDISVGDGIISSFQYSPTVAVVGEVHEPERLPFL